MAESEHSSSDETDVDSQVLLCIMRRLFHQYWTLSSSVDFGLFGSAERNQETKLEFSEDEEALVIRMYNLVGERWSLIAGRIPGRTAEEIEKYWNSRCSTSE
ncbi:MYB-like transcription factor TCL1 isoform X1 [Hevea brasiliensis]|uniref:MYB-like transcription factor TCL1 isoform X1 n=1 Tax=Hevea brasiliensis TaxID=3981 RepID=UPI000B788D0B|nr:MYB-like transcription factor TCL1 isoform X1 [Hevea brasiliensis]